MEWLIIGIYVLSLIGCIFIVAKLKKEGSYDDEVQPLMFVSLVPIFNTIIIVWIGLNLLTDWLAEKL